MAFNKSFYKQHEKQIKEEADKYEAVSEKKKLKTKKCSHRNVKRSGNTLRCSCGAFWQGAGIDKLERILTS